MQITATNFRKDMFQVFERAKQGEEVLVSHKGEQFRLVPEKPVSKLSRLRPIQLLNPGSTEADEEKMKQDIWDEMEAEWDFFYGKAPKSDRLP